MIGVILLIALFYFLFGSLVFAFYSLWSNLDFPYLGNNTQDEDSKAMLIWSFWPIYILYLLIKAIIWYFKHLYISIKDVFQKNVKFK